MFNLHKWPQCFIPFLSFLHVFRREVSSDKLGRMLGAPPSSCPLRLCGISGYDGRVNDIIYCHPLVRPESDVAVVFFGGDVQDFPEVMENHKENKNYLKWNLESTALLLHSYFPDSHVVVVRPSRLSTHKLPTFVEFVSSEMDQNRMEFKTFSCYDNFVPCNNTGAPDHTPTHHALQHLERLLQSISMRLRNLPVNQTTSSEAEKSQNEDVTPLWWQEGINLDKANLVLVGFSKGCVVLNQFLYEFHYLKTLTPDDQTMMRIVTRIQDMYWLDGGHAGGKNSWITSRSLLETLTRLGIGIHIHVTPYQVQDDRRPWIRKEEKAFGDLLKRLGAPVQRTLHFENQAASLCTHFEVLSAFRQPDG